MGPYRDHLKEYMEKRNISNSNSNSINSSVTRIKIESLL